VKISGQVEEIKKNRINWLNGEMECCRKYLRKLHEIGYGFVSYEMIYKIYKSNIALKMLASKIDYHEERLNREKVLIESNLTDKIKSF
jgi:hypothetical protein